MKKLCAILGACIAVLAAACVSSPWQKAGADPASVQEDVRQCEQQANVDARKLAASGIGDKPIVGVTPRGRAGVMNLPRGAAPIDPVAEDDFFRACMRDHGYSREPAR